MCNLEICSDEDYVRPARPDSTTRRNFIAGAVSLPLATVLAWPELAKAAADTMENIKLDLGNGVQALGALAMPKDDGKKHPALILFHEWWGLNDQIKAVAAEYANMGYITLAADLYQGRLATSREEAGALTKAFNMDASMVEIAGLINHIRALPQSNGKLASLGWCFGGAVSINAALQLPIDAAVVYYGRLPQTADALKSLKVPVIGHFGTLDKNINQEMVSGFEAAAKEAGVADQITTYWYEANHAFANPTGANYQSEAATLAWDRTKEFLTKNIG